ncbi:NEW3 domain-containing protein [Actinopolymorpha pittospori]|uniref:NPCBM-associated, NEW3 domain of alpha-galactosidase n=1 Tax=Actinopolymorpha pittospori TaxID=648752 RepID=A0A927NAJ5_9ACTN|nr:NEW3 domain-containing protein [Actinopolymorpha pittospori]MBE1613243.1 hypothetical protein [Actinopolymorpha pittospori]
MSHSTGRLSRRAAIGLLLSAAVLPPVVGARPAAARAEPLPRGGASAASTARLPDALRRIDKPNLRLRQVARLTGSRHRVTFHEAEWDGGRTYVRDLEVRTSDGTWLAVTDPDHRFDEQWVVFTGAFPGGPFYYYGPMEPHWIAFDSLTQVGTRTVELRAGDDAFDLVLRWTLDGDNPELQWTLTAKESTHYVVGYQAFDALTDSDVEEVLCGALQHARVIGSAAALSAWELFAPMALVQREVARTSVTTGVYIPAEVIAFEHERALASDKQPFGMSLRNDTDGVTTAVYAPQFGLRSAMRAGEKRGYAFGLCALPTELTAAYEDMCRREYDYTAYRENVYDNSLTDTIHNITDLVSIEPDRDDSTDFVPSFSGWWNRAKGFADVENDQCVRTAVSGVLLAAYNLTSPPTPEHDLYQARARHLIEYQLSRKGIGYTPIKGKAVYGDATQYRVGKVPGDAATLVPLYLQTRGQNAGIHKLAMDVLLADRQGLERTPVSVPLAGYLLTGDPAYLAEAKTTALRYIRDLIDTPYTTNLADNSFGYSYSKGWTELLVLFEVTGDRRFLDGAHKEARRFITQTEVRPVPDIEVTVPIPPVSDSQFDWPNGVLPDYPREEPVTETVPAWYVSTSGATFEQLTTFKIGTSGSQPTAGGGFVSNPCWVPFLLRLAHHTGDDLIADVAHNMVVGRFTNYPGYYNRQFSVDRLKPDYPLQGPPGITGIYFHHAPAQLGLAIDYLLSEQFVRSGGQIDFPRLFESNFVYFKFSVYGHAPGTFYGETGVWPYFPKGLIGVDNPAVNWFTAVGNSSLYLSLTNESRQDQQVTVEFASPLTGIDKGASLTVHPVRAGRVGRPRKLRGTTTTVTVPARGIAALVVRDVDIDVPWHTGVPGADRSDASYHFEDTDPGTDFGLASGLLLVRPDRSGYDAYVSLDTEEPSTLRYRVGDGPVQETPPKPFPYEWTIGVDGLTDTFRYQIVAGALTTAEVTLRLPSSVNGVVDGVGGELVCSPTTTPGDKVSLTARVRNGTDADVTGLTVALTAPSGWTVHSDQPTTTVPARGVADLDFSVTVPADAALADHPLTATATWTGGHIDLDATSILVRQPRKVTSLSAPTSIARPGDQASLVATVLNQGPIPLSAQLRLTPPAGWTVDTPLVTVELPARSEQTRTFVATSSTSVVPGNQYRFSVTSTGTGSGSKALNIKVSDAGIIVNNFSYYPSYQEAGEWLGSGLAGWNGVQSRYSAPEVLGGSATWAPELPEEGEYDVSVWYPSNADTTTAAAYVITHAGGTDEVIVNQQENANRWSPLGRFRFEQGRSGSVRLEVRNEKFHRLSAAQFVYVGP